MTFLRHPSCSFGLIHGFSGSLYSWMAKGSFCLLVKWTDTAFWLAWLARQKAYNWVQCWFNRGHVGRFSIHCQEGEQRAPMSRPTPPFSL